MFQKEKGWAHMFRVGDWVIYGHGSVCRVEEIGHPMMPGLDPAREYYRALLAEHSCERLLRLCKTLYAKQASLMHTRRSVSATDLRSWKAAEEMLFGEFGFVLGIPPAQVRGMLEEQIGGQ